MTWNKQLTPDPDVKHLQDNLCSLRRIAGWDQDALALKLGVPRSTIAGFEREKPIPMSRAFYIAIMALLDNEVQSNKSNTLFTQAMAILFGNGDGGNEENNDLAKAVISVIGASVASGGADNEKSNELLKKMLNDVSEASGLKNKSGIAPYSWLHEPEPQDSNETRRERINLLFDDAKKVSAILKAIPADGYDVAAAALCLEPDLLSKADSLVCKSLFEDIWDKWQKKRVPTGSAQALAELKLILEMKQPEPTKELHLFGLLCGEKFLAHSRIEGKEYIKFRLYRAYRKFEEIYEPEEE